MNTYRRRPGGSFQILAAGTAAGRTALMTDLSTIKALFGEAQELLSPGERKAFLDKACGSDAELRRRVEELLDADDLLGETFLMPALAQANSPKRHAIADRTIGPYELVKVLGEGGMGTVYLARQSAPLKRDVAFKVIKEGFASASVIARFEAERQTLALMDHPNVARVFDAGTTSRGQPYFVMEYVRGDPITKFCDEQRLSVRERLALFVDACRAIQHAHLKGVIHRDIKPSNILVATIDGKAVLKVIDFGVAKAIGKTLSNDALTTQAGMVMGTLEYMSPEQAGLGETEVDTRTDVYALGAVLYELITGTPPLHDTNLRRAALLEMLRIIREVDPPKPSTRISTLSAMLPEIARLRQIEPGKLQGEVRGELDWIALKALEKVRVRRYETAAGLARDVELYLKDEPIDAMPPTRWYRFKKAYQRNKASVIAGALVMLALIVGAGLATWQAFRATDAEHDAESKREAAVVAQREEARMRLEADAAKKLAQSEGEAARQALARAQITLADSFSASGQFDAEAGRYGRAQLWFAAAANAAGETDPVREHANRFRAQEFGRRAANPVRMMSVEARGTSIRSMRFFPDGRHLLIDNQYRVLLLCDLEKETLVNLGPQNPTSVAAHPDKLRFAVAYDNGVVAIRRLADLSVETEFKVPEIGRPLEFSPDGRWLFIGGTKASLWDLAEKKLYPGSLDTGEQLIGAAFDPQSKLLVASTRKFARVFNVPPNSEKPLLAQFPNNRGNNHFVPAFVQNGTRVVTCPSQSEVALWDLASGACVVKGETRTGMVELSPDGSLINDNAGLVNVYNGTRAATAPGFNGRFTPDGCHLVSAQEEKIWLIDARTGAQVAQIGFNAENVAYGGVAVSPDGTLVATLHIGGQLCVWQLPLAPPAQHLQTPQNSQAVFSADGKHLVLAGELREFGWDTPQPGETRVFSLPTLQPAGPRLITTGIVLGAQFIEGTPHVALICSSKQKRSQAEMFKPDGASGNLQFWDWKTGTQRQPPVPLPSEPRILRTSPFDNELALLCAGGEVFHVEPATGTMRLLATVNGGNICESRDTDLADMRFTQDGRTLAVWNGASDVHVFDWPDGRERFAPIQNGQMCGITVKTMKDGGSILATIHSGRLGGESPCFWDIQTGRPAPSGLDHAVNWIPTQGRFSDDGTLFLFSGILPSIKLWDWRNGLQHCPDMKHRIVARADFIPKTNWLISIGSDDNDGWVRFWDRDSGTAIAPAFHAPFPWDLRRLNISPDGKWAATEAYGPGLFFFNLSGLRELEHPDFTAEDWSQLAMLNAGGRLQNGGIVLLPKNELIANWIDFRQRHPDYHRLELPELARLRWHRFSEHVAARLFQPFAVQWHRERAEALEAKLSSP